MVDSNKSGGTRYSEGKVGGWWYTPMLGMRFVAKVAKYGSDKYAPFDWKAGQDFSVLWDCMFRHLLEAQHHGLFARDHESGEYHLAHAAWNLLALLTFIEEGRTELDDITPWEGKTAADKDY